MISSTKMKLLQLAIFRLDSELRWDTRKAKTREKETKSEILLDYKALLTLKTIIKQI